MSVIGDTGAKNVGIYISIDARFCTGHLTGCRNLHSCNHYPYNNCHDFPGCQNCQGWREDKRVFLL